MAQTDVDLLVLGGGAAGLTAAGTAANLGAKTMMVERHRLGGDCTWTGCVPSKPILHAAHLRANARAFLDRFASGDMDLPEADFSGVIRDVHEIREEVYQDADAPEIFEAFGVEVGSGNARLTGPNSAHIDGPDGGRDVPFRKAILCTGGRAAPPPITGLDQTPHLTNESLFEIERQPRHLVVIGAGPIGCEMGQAFRRLGSEVTVLDRGGEILGKDDADHAAILRGVLEREGIRFELGADITRVEGEEGAITVHGERDGQPITVEGDVLLIATGRKPNIEALGLEQAGEAYPPRGITVTNRCRTSVGHIRAARACPGEYAQTHMSEHMGKQAATNAVLKVPAAIDRGGMTWTTFTTPEVAQVGPTAAELRQRGQRFVTYRFPYTKVDRAITEHATAGHIKVHATQWTGKILGASVVGERAGELVSLYAVAKKAGVSVKTISDTIFAYPTYGLAARRAADQYYVQKAFPAFVDAVKRVFRYRGQTPPPPDPNRVL